MPYKNTQKRKEFNKQYYQKNRLVLLEKQKEYNESHREERSVYTKKYRQTESCKKSMRISQKKWNEKNRDMLNEYQHNWRNNNPELILKYNKKHLDKIGKPLDLSNYMVKRTLYFWSKAVRERDGNKCTECGSIKRLHAHHVLEKNDYPEFALIQANGMTVCHNCHWNIHRENHR